MSYVALGLRPTHDLSFLGLSELAAYKTRSTTSHTEPQATVVRGQRGTEMTMMVPELFISRYKERDQGSQDE
jgi:hypothetical protein